MAVKIKWNGQQFKGWVDKKIHAFLRAAGKAHLIECKKAVNVANTGQRIKLKSRRTEQSVAKATRKKRLEGISGKAELTRRGRVGKLRGTYGRRKAGSRVPIYIPGVGWRLSKRRRKRTLTQSQHQITVYPNSSKPGQSVRKRTGVGRDHVVGGYSRQQKAWRTGYGRGARYMAMHEGGINYPRGGRQKRPTVVPVFRRNQEMILRVGRNTADRVPQ